MKSFPEFIKTNEDAARELLSSHDYRTFLKNFFILKKKLSSSYSYAVFARQAKVSKSLPRDISEGLKRITDKTLPNFVKAMELDGLLEEFFVQLVATETDPNKAKLVEKVAQLYIETHFTKTYNESNFKDFKAPFLYAASGEMDEGSSLELMANRTGFSLDVVELSMSNLEELKLGKYDKQTRTFIPSTTQVHVTPKKEDSFFRNFFLYCLDLQRDTISKNFNPKKSFFYNEVFSVNEKDLPGLTQELKKVLKNFVIKAENSKGDSVAVLNLGFFKQNFSIKSDQDS